MTLAIASRLRAKHKPTPVQRPYIRGREFVTHHETTPQGVTLLLDCLYTTMVAMVRLHDPFQNPDTQEEPCS